MLDFIKIGISEKKGYLEVSPNFLVKRSKDLMIRGSSFYAVWDDQNNRWTTDEYEAFRLIDDEVLAICNTYDVKDNVIPKLMNSFNSNKVSEWNKFCKLLPDNYHQLDDRILFSNDVIKKEDHATRHLSYPLQPQETPAYNRLMSVLYDPEERRKIEWSVGAIIAGDSRWIQKFLVFYGAPGTGKSTVLKIIQDMFQGYWSSFNSKALGSNSEFALESIRNNPLIAIQHEGDLSKIETNANLNSIVSHEMININEKYKSSYDTQFHSFLMLGTNKPVKITDAKSGIIRRLIDVNPTGNQIPRKEFEQLLNQIKFEHSGIAWHCLKDVYEKLGPSYYDGYVATSMIGTTNDFYNFIEDNYDLFKDVGEDGLSLSTAWMRYKSYCEEAKVTYPYSMRMFKYELKNYFDDFKERYGNRYSVYFGFKKDKFEYQPLAIEKSEEFGSWLKFDCSKSLLDEICFECPAQYATEDGKPLRSWDSVETGLGDLDSRKLHYVRVPENLIVIDFDLKDENGEKSYESNLEAASRWPETYGELSKSGSGIHLHYYYDGDPSELSRIFADDIEIKVFSGKSSLRRMVTKCNNIEIAHISSGLPLKERRGKMVKEEIIRSEKSLRSLIERNLRKEIHPGTKPSIDFIYKILDDAYNSGLKYDVTDLRPAVQNFAMNSTHQADYCLRMLVKMKFQSDEISENEESRGEEVPIVFFDVEVFPNLFVVVAKRQGPENTKITMINPKPSDVEDLTKFRLVGFNNRRYDNHILYARIMGYNEKQLYDLSQRIIAGDKSAFFGEAYNLSYTDIYDFLSAGNKMSLKKWEIKLGIHHQELGLPWDVDVPEKLWNKVAEYCGNDVDATEAVFNSPDGQADWTAREILAEWAEMTVNDTTNSLTTKLIVGNDKHPQDQFVYTDLATIYPGYEYNPYGIPAERYKAGVKIVSGKSIYKGKDPGEGGYAIGYPGIYYQVAVLDIASMHPHSAIRLNIFGDVYTKKFADIVEPRVLIKHRHYESAKQILPERLWKYLNGDKKTAKNLANALKTAINSVYGLTSASFDNKLRDPRNKDNIVAKYGALFMINLEEEVQKRGYQVVHIKTDSIKIANADEKIIKFVKEYGQEYGFTFEHECTYDKICLINDAVYIAKVGAGEDGAKLENPYWTATGTQFQVPYVFKTLFSGEPIEFSDLCETKSVTSALYLDFNEDLPGMGDEKSKEYEFLKGDSLKRRLEPLEQSRLEALEKLHAKCHDYRFVGKVGAFCPVKDMVGGGILLRDAGNGKFAAATGTKKAGTKDGVYRWMESEMVLKLGLEDQIDRSYYNHLVDDAIETIEKYGDFEAFVSDDVTPEWMKIPDTEEEELPFPMNEPVS